MYREPASEGLVGVLLHPDDSGDDFRRLPGVVLLGGAEGGLHEDHATLLAEQGYAVLALAYYGLPGVPEVLRDIPLEYFGRALDYLRAHPRVDGDRVGVFGGSKGGEAALLIAATFPEKGIRAVVSVAGSGVATQGICQSVVDGDLRTILTTPVASWTYQGREVPYLPNVMTSRMERALDAGEPVALGWAKPDLSDVERVAQAAIPVERIDGAVLLIVGGDDQNYGAEFHEIAARRLEEYGHPHTWRHVVHDGAGHFIIAPQIAPTSQTSPGPDGIVFLHGGTPQEDSRARAETWRETLEFFARELGLEVRPARSEELALLPEIEVLADGRFAGIGLGPLPPAAGLEELMGARCVLVAGTPPVGFARMEVVDGQAHLEQLSVHPGHGRRGVGGGLLRAACRWAGGQGHSLVTLCTFADVPWNAAFYARYGFVPVPEDALTPGLRALRRRELELGLDALGRRTVMVRRVSGSSQRRP